MNRRSTRTARSSAGSGFAWGEWVPVFFLIFVVLLGGSGRSDVASLPILRGGSLLFACWAATRLGADDWRRIRVPLALWFAATLWMAIQLIPLPPEVWHALPGRDIIVQIDRLVGQADLWRPISLSPSQTMNSLLAMTVPLAALLVAAQVPAEDYRRLTLAIIGIACFSVLLGAMQMLSGPGSAFYTYRITNVTNMVGLFANSNHHALFLAAAVALIGAALRDELIRKRRNKLLIGLLGAAGLFLVALTPFTGSRVGFLAAGGAFAVSYLMVVLAWKSQSEEPAPSRRGTPAPNMGRYLIYAPPVLLVAALSAVLFLTNRVTSLSRAFGEDVAGDLRVQTWPTVRSMIETYWELGSGFGSFPGVYKIYEPDNLLQASYFNHAHNDWAELLITGGAPFALIVLGLILWIAVRVWSLGLRNLLGAPRGDLRLPVLMVVAILVAVSFAEYPLRVPSIQALAVVLVVMLCSPKTVRTV